MFKMKMYHITLFNTRDWQAFSVKGQLENSSGFGAFGLYHNSPTLPLFAIICGEAAVDNT